MSLFTGLLSAVNPYGTILKLAGVAILIGLLIWCGSTLNTWHSASQELPAVQAQLAVEQKAHQAEIDCLAGTTCARRITHEVEEAKAETAKQLAINAQREKENSEYQQQQDERHRNQLRIAAATNARQLADVISHQHTSSCEAFRVLINPCPSQVQ